MADELTNFFMRLGHSNHTKHVIIFLHRKESNDYIFTHAGFHWAQLIVRLVKLLFQLQV